MSEASPLGIIAGGGGAPRQLIEACRHVGRAFFVLCLEGQTDETLVEGDVPHAWLPMGAGEQFKKIIAAQRVKEIVMIGRVRRPSLVELKPDMLALKVLTKAGINSLGDDALLTAVGKAIEAETGARLIGVQDIFADFLTPEGVLTRGEPDKTAQDDIRRGLEVVLELGQLDIGQAVVVQQGLVLGVEAIEGTDALITRSAALQRAGERGVLVKFAKPQQDARFDLPAIGPDTVEAVARAGLRGIAVEAGRSLLLERDKTVRMADDAGLFIVGLTKT